MGKFLLLAIILLTIERVQSKMISSQIAISSFNRLNSKLLTKYTTLLQGATFDIQIRFQRKVEHSNPPEFIPLTLHLITAENWNKVKNSKICNEKAYASLVSKEVKVPPEGTWSPLVFEEIIPRKVEPTIKGTTMLYVLIADCEKRLPEYTDYGNKLVVEFNIKNQKGQHFSYEESSTYWTTLLCIFINAGMIFLNVRHLTKYKRANNELNYVQFYVLIAVCVETLAVSLRYFHLTSLSNDGKGLFFFEFLWLVFTFLAEYSNICFFILLSWKWGVDNLELEDWDLYLPASLALAILQGMVVILEKLIIDDSSKLFEFDTFSGYVIIVFKIGFAAYFVYSIWESFEKTKKMSQRSYLNFLLIGGLLYILSFPIFFLITILSEAYEQYTIFYHYFLFHQLLWNVVMSYIVCNNKSKYYSVFIQNRLLLPSSKGE